MRNVCFKKALVIGIIILFIGVNIVSGISINENEDNSKIDVTIPSSKEIPISTFTFYTFFPPQVHRGKGWSPHEPQLHAPVRWPH